MDLFLERHGPVGQFKGFGRLAASGPPKGGDEMIMCPSDLIRDWPILLFHLRQQAANEGIDLGEAVMSKWNRTSVKVGAPIRIDAEDWHWTKK